MSREHLYKAKRVNWMELPKEQWWVEGYYFCMTHTGGRHNHHFIIPIGEDLSLGTPIEKIQIEVEPETVCEYTQMTDINKNKIWENDIVAYMDTYSTDNGYAESYCAGKVLWCEEELCFYVTERLSAESWEVLEDCCVIGNTFDNPELLQNE